MWPSCRDLFVYAVLRWPSLILTRYLVADVCIEIIINVLIQFIARHETVSLTKYKVTISRRGLPVARSTLSSP